MTVNTSEAANENGSAVDTTNQRTPIQHSSVPLSSRPHLTGSTPVWTPNTAHQRFTIPTNEALHGKCTLHREEPKA